MYKCLITIVFLINIFSANAQDWTKSEIENIKKFSIQSLQDLKDPSNKYINNPKAIDLGKVLFNDVRLSSNGKVSCSSCHKEKYAFTDNKKLSSGIREGFRNTSTLLNAGYQHWFFADGAKDSLWAQALSSIENPDEQNYTRMEVMHLVASDKHYQTQYQQIFPNPLPKKTQLVKLPKKAGPNAKLKDLKAWKKLSKAQRHDTNILFTNIGKAIAAYVATIKSKPNRLDHYIGEINPSNNSKELEKVAKRWGDVFLNKLNASEQRGLSLFISQESGCSICHSGPLFSNKSFHDIATGIPGKDNGRSEVIESVVRDEFNCLSKYSDAKPSECMELHYVNRNKHQLTGSYKTPTLRSIAKTAPYMHDGRFETLNEVIEHYVLVSQRKPGETDLTAISLSVKQKTDLINFLLTL